MSDVSNFKDTSFLESPLTELFAKLKVAARLVVTLFGLCLSNELVAANINGTR